MKTILLADDNETNNRLLKDLIQSQFPDGFEIMEVSNGLEAVEACKSKKIDLIFMDFKMPVMGGGVATLEIKEKVNPNIPVILLTAYLISEIRSLFSGLEYFNEIETKPIGFDKIRMIIEKYLF